MEADVVEIMDTWLQARLERLHTTMPGTIQSYDPKTRTATVVPGIRLRSLHGESITIKPIQQVPVVFPGTKRFSLIPANMEAGDGVILHFSESSMGNWLNGDGVRDAEDETRFSLHDCIAVAGLWSTRTAPSNQDLGEADFGLSGNQGEVLGGKDGKLDLRNGISDLRKELETLYTQVATLRTDLSTALTALAGVCTSAAALVPVGPVPVTPMALQLTTSAGLVVAGQAPITAAKTGLQGLLA